ncbi:MAG: DNA alkylation repair protein [Bacteroidaceae bacterium]|nr:DNA alkylation repair protein [Bacteroidaceae bacterium]
MNDIIIQIKKELRANMNGIASEAMGRKSEDYRVNFGVEIPRLHNIATEFQPSHELAQQLWKESVRECRILATILQPVDSFLPEIADIWVDDIRTLELAQVASLNLFSRLSYASDKVFQWIASEREITQQCGYLTLCHIMRKGEMNERSADEFIDQALTAYAGGSMMLQRTLMRAFAIFAENNPSAAKRLPKEFR